MSNDKVASLLDSNLDDLADLPEFKVPPAGAYNATILSIEEKEIGSHPAVEMKFKLLETLELASPTDAPVENGTECGVAFMLDNEFGVGALKAALKPLATAFGTSTSRETMAAAKGASIMLVTKVRQGKKGTDSEDKTYLGLHKIEVL
jgi:hypothetical protein